MRRVVFAHRSAGPSCSCPPGIRGEDSGLAALLGNQSEARPYDQIIYRVGWGLTASLAFLCPLLFAAAIRLYLIDRRVHRGAPLEWQTLCVALILAFAACWGLAALPIVLVETIRGAQLCGGLNLIYALLLAVPPALVNSSFVLLSGLRRNGSPLRRGAADFAIFGLIGGASALLVLGFQRLRSPVDYPFWEIYAADIATIVVISGLFGALQCSISRGFEAGARRAAGGPEMRLQPIHG
jgi:hypothetical protein